MATNTALNHSLQSNLPHTPLNTNPGVQSDLQAIYKSISGLQVLVEYTFEWEWAVMQAAGSLNRCWPSSVDAEEFKAKMKEFDTFQRPYSQEKIEALLEISKANMKNNKETLVREIKKAALRRKNR